ncbi:MAG: translation elongation factor 4 [Candidatus Shikimatogenerans bostrichidophilus]|nr:MAG: translation elongation factor 4 [Candidatus Shikimatogenerans bostrichidophilus]
MKLKYIRNFCIIAHIDHGKSSLAYQLLKITKSINNNNNLLDNMELEKEKGITIKNHIIQIYYKYNNKKYKLNLIDTPGHADFTYEVYKSILASEGAILLIDISKNIQAQTISNLKIALTQKKKIIPVLNKIDLNIDTTNVINNIRKLIKCKKNNILLVSAKFGNGINKLIKHIIKYIPSPTGDIHKSLQALIIDSYYDKYKGIIIYIRIFNGIIKEKDKIKLLSNNKIILVKGLYTLEYKNRKIKYISAGDVGSFLYKSKNIDDIIIGDTIVSYNDKYSIKITDIKIIQSNIFISIFPINSSEYIKLENSIKKLKLNDYSFSYYKDFSNTFGNGFRCGFLGLLHFEIIKERIIREYNINIISTIPNVKYKIILKDKSILYIDDPTKYPPKNNILYIMEPYVEMVIITYNIYIGNIITYCINKRGKLINQIYNKENKVKLIFHIPLNEILSDFNNKLKILTKGYNSMTYNIIGYFISDIIKVDIFINNIRIDVFSFFSNIKTAYSKSKKICKKLKELIPRKQFKIPIQAYIDNKIIARETINPYRKDVTSKCYGGDITRKMKLLNKQKKGKKRMYKIGKVDLPKSIFYSLININ